MQRPQAPAGGGHADKIGLSWLIQLTPGLIVHGGSIALGHPFGATGGRLTITLLREMRRRGLGLGLITVCAAGGLGFAMVCER